MVLSYYTQQTGLFSVLKLYQITKLIFYLANGATVLSGGMTCREILYATVMQSVVVGCSILSIVISQFVAFISIRALGWMTQVQFLVSKRKGAGGERHFNAIEHNPNSLTCTEIYEII